MIITVVTQNNILALHLQGEGLSKGTTSVLSQSIQHMG